MPASPVDHDRVFGCSLTRISFEAIPVREIYSRERTRVRRSGFPPEFPGSRGDLCLNFFHRIESGEIEHGETVSAAREMGVTVDQARDYQLSPGIQTCVLSPVYFRISPSVPTARILSPRTATAWASEDYFRRQ